MKRLFVVMLSYCVVWSVVFSYDLRLTEVLVDGSDEFVEISNMSSDPFAGNLTLSGAKSSLLTLNSISIPAWSSLIVGDSLAMLSSYGGTTMTNMGLNLTDTAAVNLSIRQSATLLDSFVISSSDVIVSDNAKTSFHKYFVSGTPTISLSTLGLSSSVIPGFIAHPGKVYDGNGALLIPQSVVPGTGSNSGTSVTIDCATVLSGILHIDELHDGSQYADYIELVFDQDWVGGLVLSGNAISTPFSLPSQSWLQGTRYVIANSLSGFHHSANVVIVPGRSLSTGLFTISSLSQQGLAFALIDTGGQSVYHTTDYNCVADFATLAAPSPGFDQIFLSYLNTNTITTTVSVTGACATSGSTSLSGGGGILTGSSSSGNIAMLSLAPGDIKISLIDYDPPGSDTNNERIGFLSLSGDIGLSGLSLSYDGKLYKLTTGTVLSGQEIVLTGNYSFVNSRTVCVALYNQSLLIDTACYDPTQDGSPVLPLQSSSTSGQNSTGATNQTENYDNLQFDIRSLIYDPEGSDTNNESVTIYFSGGASGVLLDDFRLRVGTSNKRIYGWISSGETKTLMGNFQMSNSNPTCVALTYGEILYDEYCYNPVSYSYSPSSTVSSPVNTTSNLYTSCLISLIGVEYDPEGSDTDRETVTLLMTGNQEAVDLTKLYIRFGSTKRQLKGMLAGSGMIIVTGNFQMPNSKATCIDLMEGSHVFDSYCYDPTLEDPEGSEDSETTKKTQGTGDVNNTKKKTSDPVVDWLAYYSGLQLEWILPNPKDKDIKGDNELIGFRFASGLVLNKHVKIVVGKTSISLSESVFTGERLVFVSPKSLVNQAACARLFVDGQEIDQLCYPQAKEGQVYYHERFAQQSLAIPNSLIDRLDAQEVDLSSLLLKKSGSQICLVYDTISIRCMAGGSTKTSATTKYLITLGNAYISQMDELISSKKMQYTTMKTWTDAYRELAKLIKQGKSTITIRGHTIATTDLEGYKTLLYERQNSDVVLDALLYTMFGATL